MHCWKTINVKKQYGMERLFFLSSILVMSVFSIVYALQGTINDSHKSDDFFWLFAIGMIMVYPLHKLFHFLPLFTIRDHIKVTINRRYGFLPIVSIKVCEPINKYQFIFSLLSPFIFINAAILIGALAAPHFAHYFIMLLAYHCGMCLIDLIYVKNLSKSPRSAFVEETDAGYQILIVASHH
ncbi:DUF3267 domain-containing protein [uncultured Psychrobacillus sp.]|mgnify:FL=1|uniref:DUF3267 domain-containing protein n=1 Tax=uncultured Psychrobacillus sp. TaxID=1551585 RepID=UPI00262CC323|nr:DUF3267 domain-containing protein [uncultured Psychrobacillus sp.]